MSGASRVPRRGWRQAADYSRRGPEILLHYLSRAVATAKTGIPTYETLRERSSYSRFERAQLNDVEGIPRDRHSSPDARERPKTDGGVMLRAPHGGPGPGGRVDSSIVGIDLVARECTRVRLDFWLGAEPRLSRPSAAVLALLRWGGQLIGLPVGTSRFASRRHLPSHGDMSPTTRLRNTTTEFECGSACIQSGSSRLRHLGT